MLAHHDAMLKIWRFPPIDSQKIQNDFMCGNQAEHSGDGGHASQRLAFASMRNRLFFIMIFD
jgi:hypothetical protein